MKFKVGDRVRVIREGSHAQEIGAICKIVKIDDENMIMPYLAKCPDNNEMWFDEDQLELADTQFTKSNLQNGDIVTYRDGQKRTVMCNKLINEDGTATNYLTIYKDDLTYKNSQRDIVKVERSIGYETIFERKEEILDETEKRYLASVIRPFRDEVEYIVKNQNIDGEFIHIELDGDSLNFPYLRDETMYKRMKPDKRYTLEELGL